MEWQENSDAAPREGVIAVDAETGRVYGPNLEGLLDSRKNRRCGYHVIDAGFTSNSNVEILVHVHLFTYVDEGTELEGISADKRCTEGDETWSFNYTTR